MLACRDGQADIAQKAGMVEGQVLPLGAQNVGQFGDAVVKAGDLNGAVGVMQAGKDAGQDVDGVLRQTAIHAGMQVAAGGAEGQLLAQQPAQHGDDGRGAALKQAGVADQRDLGLQFGGIGLQERDQGRRAGFLLALQKDRQLAGQGAVDGLPGAAGFEKGHQLALVIGGATGAQDAAFRGILDDGIKGVVVPQRQGIDRLHVVMAVKQQMGAAAATMGHHHGMAGRRAGRGVKAQRLQVGDQPVGGAGTIGLEGRIGRD